MELSIEEPPVGSSFAAEGVSERGVRGTAWQPRSAQRDRRLFGGRRTPRRIRLGHSQALSRARGGTSSAAQGSAPGGHRDPVLRPRWPPRCQPPVLWPSRLGQDMTRDFKPAESGPGFTKNTESGKDARFRLIGVRDRSIRRNFDGHGKPCNCLLDRRNSTLDASSGLRTAEFVHVLVAGSIGVRMPFRPGASPHSPERVRAPPFACALTRRGPCAPPLALQERLPAEPAPRYDGHHPRRGRGALPGVVEVERCGSGVRGALGPRPQSLCVSLALAQRAYTLSGLLPTVAFADMLDVGGETRALTQDLYCR